MPLHEESIRAGQRLFRWRTYIPLLFFVMLWPGYFDLQARQTAAPGLVWDLICLGVSLLGLIIRALTIGFTPRGTSGRNTRKQIAEKLNTSGIYGMVRNPLYLGNYFLFLGVMLYLQLWYMPVVFTLIFWLYYERIILTEEDFLRDKFGAEYLEWAEGTPAFLPRCSGWTPPEISFSLNMVLKREHNGLLALATVFSLFNLFRNWSLGESPGIDPGWLNGFYVSVGVFILIEVLKRYTHVLRVRPREQSPE